MEYVGSWHPHFLIRTTLTQPFTGLEAGGSIQPTCLRCLVFFFSLFLSLLLKATMAGGRAICYFSIWIDSTCYTMACGRAKVGRDYFAGLPLRLSGFLVGNLMTNIRGLGKGIYTHRLCPATGRLSFSFLFLSLFASFLFLWYIS